MNSAFFVEGNEPESRKVPGLTPSVQPEAVGLETHVKLGLDLEYERDGKWIDKSKQISWKALIQENSQIFHFSIISTLPVII